MTTQTSGAEPRPEPLFALELKENGRLVAPSSVDEIHNWINQEINFWSWVKCTQPGGNHDQGLRHALSHLHLATNVAGRVVMARTYFSLLEGDRLESNEDTKLILQALSRPISDGIIKD